MSEKRPSLTDEFVPEYEVEEDSAGEFAWFCSEPECNWSGHGLMTEQGAHREAKRHDCRSTRRRGSGS